MAENIMDCRLYKAEHSWSMLDAKPVLMYLQKHDEYIVMWNGAIMPYAHALCIAGEQLGIYTSPSMRDAMNSTFFKLYHAGAFGEQHWDQIVEGNRTFTYLRGFMFDHVDKLSKISTGTEILGWFDFSNARII